MACEPALFPGGDFDPTARFPEMSLGLGLTAQLVFVGVELATAWLAMRSDKQRSLKKAHLESIVRDVAAGRWRLNGETVIFNHEGQLIDGQHRLTAVVRTGQGIWVVVIRGVDPDAYASIDLTAKRQGGDTLKAMDVQNATTVASAACYLIRYEKGIFYKGSYVLSPMELREILDRHPGLALTSSIGRAAARVCRSGAVAVFCYYLFSRVDQAAADDFFGKLVTGEDLSRGSPILAFRRLMEGNRYDPDRTAHLLIKAWNAFRENRQMMVLRWAPSEEFPAPI